LLLLVFGNKINNFKYIITKNAEALLVATKEIGLEVNAENTKYMVMSRNRNARRDDSVKIDNSSIERVE
jgi:hypothetical protein